MNHLHDDDIKWILIAIVAAALIIHIFFTP